MNSQVTKEKIKLLPDTPGVYFFFDKKGKILYIGKATSIRDRVKSYFANDLMSRRGPLITRMIEEVESVKYVQTDSVLEALILEANEIKKNQPYYNSREKDDKSYNYVVITKEEFPRLLLVRGRDLLKTKNSNLKIYKQFGPFPHVGELKEAMKIIRKIFPYRDEKCKIQKILKPCFPAQLGLCPGPCAGWISKADYKKNIQRLKLFFEAKKPQLIKSLEKDMSKFAKEKRFEDAEKIKKKIYALEHIQDIALIKKEIESTDKEADFRIESYDIAHLAGKQVVGVMTVSEDGELAKNQYRKFKIKSDKNNDVANLREVIERRLGHVEWRLPNLIVVDGGVAQINAVKEVLKERGFSIDVVSVVKDSRHKAREIIGSKKYIEKYGSEILLVNSEAHRFAINYHRLLRSKGFRI